MPSVRVLLAGGGRDEQLPGGPGGVAESMEPVRPPRNAKSAHQLINVYLVVRDSDSGHQLLLPPAKWCPIFAPRTTHNSSCCTYPERKVSTHRLTQNT